MIIISGIPVNHEYITSIMDIQLVVSLMKDTCHLCTLRLRHHIEGNMNREAQNNIFWYVYPQT